MAEQVSWVTRFERVPEALWRRGLDGLLVFAPTQTEPLWVSSPGDLAWLLLSEPLSFAEVADDLADLFGVSAAAVRRDLQPMLRAFVDCGALRVAS